MEIVWFLLIGMAAGWLAGHFMKFKAKKGLAGNLVVGVIGALLGGFVFRLAGVSVGGGLAARLVVATVGAAILLWLLQLIRRQI